MAKIIRSVPYPAIDGIRFYAALVVLIQHTVGSVSIEYFHISGADFTTQSESAATRFWAYVADGNHGVDIFFLISGFLMARIVLSSKSFKYDRFIWSRFQRIYPAFLVSLVLATLILCRIFGWPWSPVDFAKDLMFLNAIPGKVKYPYNHVTWSLGYEFAFYLVIPAFRVFTRSVDRQIVAIAAALACAYFMPLDYIRMFGLFAGAVIGAFDDEQLKRFASRIPLVPTFACFLGLGIAKAYLSLNYFAYFYSFVLVAALLLIKVVWDSNNELNRFFSRVSMRWLGTLSYSIYLYHSLVGALVLYYLTPTLITIGGAIWFTAATFLLTIGVSYLSYVLVEQRYFTNKQHQRVAPIGALPEAAGT